MPLKPYWPRKFGGSVPIWPPPKIWLTGPNSDLLYAAMYGEPLGGGVYPFEPPLILSDICKLTSGPGRTILLPTKPYAGPLIVIETSAGGNYDLQYPPKGLMEGIMIQGLGTPGEVGLVVSGGNLRFQDITITGCQEGLYLNWAVNVKFDGCNFTKNVLSVDIAGCGPTDHPSVTTVAFSRCNFRYSQWGVMAQHAMALLFDDHCQFEGNGVGLLALPEGFLEIELRDSWMEANGMNTIDPQKKVRVTGFAERHG